MASENKTSKDMVKALGTLGVDLSNVKEVILEVCKLKRSKHFVVFRQENAFCFDEGDCITIGSSYTF